MDRKNGSSRPQFEIGAQGTLRVEFRVDFRVNFGVTLKVKDIKGNVDGKTSNGGGKER